MKRLLLFLLGFFLTIPVYAQYTQDFEPPANGTGIISFLRSQCWRFSGITVNSSGLTPINGVQSLTSANGSNVNNGNFIQTAFMNIDGDDSLAFTYRWNGANVNRQRWILVRLVNLNGLNTLLDSIFIDITNNSDINYGIRFTGITGTYRIELRIRGVSTGRLSFDDFFFTGNYRYPSGCFNQDEDNRLDAQDVDDDNDGIPDRFEICGIGATTLTCLGANPSADSDNDGVINFHDPDFCTLNSAGVCLVLDTDGDGVPDYRDLDSDGDGIPDALEANGGVIPNNYFRGYIGGPTSNNGMPVSAQTGNNNGIPNMPIPDSDGDGIPDHLDTDSDNDGIPDNIEAQSTFGYIAPLGIDSDGDGLDDAYDDFVGFGGAGLIPVNTDGADLPDYLDTDSDNDGRPDAMEAHDLNANAIQDAGELPFNASGLDSDNDGMDDVWDNVVGFSITNNLTPLSFPNANFQTLERDWRELFVQLAEICGNGIDDDNDGLTDCDDDDCPKPEIVSVTFNPFSNCNGTVTLSQINIVANSATSYSIDNGLNFAASSIFGNIPPGSYNVVVRNADGCTVAYINNPVVIGAPNCPPIPVNDNYTVAEDNVLNGTSVLANDDSTDGPSLNITTAPVVNVQNGTLIINSNGTFTYTPNANFNGTDVFVYEVCDGAVPPLCATATVTITVTPVNDQVVVNSQTVTTNEDTPVSGNILTNDFDPDGSALSVILPALFGPQNGSIIMNANGDFTYTPNQNFNGTDFVVFQVCDSGTPLPATCANDTLFIIINAVNDAPVILTLTETVNEDNVLNASFITSDFDPDGTALVYDVNPVFGPFHGSVVVNTNGSFVYTPNPDYFGNDTIVVNVCDSGFPLPAICTTDTVFIIINPVNDAVVVNNQTVTTNEDTPVSGNILTNDFDPEGTALSVILPAIFGPQNGSIIMNTNGDFTYTPNQNFNGTDFVVFQVCDSGIPLPATCAIDTLFFIINPVNDAVVVNNQTVTTDEDAPVSGNILTNDFDPDGSALSVTLPAVFGPQNGSIIMNANGDFTYTPNPDFNGTDFVVFQVCDSGIPLPATCANDTLFFIINPVNDAVVVNNQTVTTNEDTPVSGNILTNDFDPDGSALSVTLPAVSGPQNGSIIMNANGDFTYTPNPDFNGTDFVVFQVCDSGIPLPATCANDTLFFIINPVNDAVVVNNQTVTTNEDTPVSGNILTNDFDPDGSALSVTLPAVSGPQNGSIIMNANGDFNYTPNQDFNGTDFVVFQVCDSGIPLPATCANDTLFIIINPVNDAVVVNNQTVTTDEDTPVSGNILTNDFDPDGSALTVTLPAISSPQNGSLIMNANGDFTYTPNQNFNGTDFVVFQVCDSGIPLPATCANDTLFFVINPVNDAVVVNNQTVTTDEDTPCFREYFDE
jgi:VCBS repeat-containing protein